MALKITEFFGFMPLDPAAAQYVAARTCPFIHSACIKPNHGACSVQQITDAAPVICCPNRLYASNYQILLDIAGQAFGPNIELINPAEAKARRTGANGGITGREVTVFGRFWGQELPLPRPPGAGGKTRQYYVDWVLAKLAADGTLYELTAAEVQTIDTTGNYSDQATQFFAGLPYSDDQGRQPGYSESGMNWENVNKRILPQLIYKGHVLRREARCSKGLFFVCPKQVYERIRERLGGNLHTYNPGNGTITFRSYELGPAAPAGAARSLIFSGQFTTTVDQVAYAFVSPANLPDMNVYEQAINTALA
jgi:hypothetical protein